jgi:hypothetical protein
VAGCAKTHTWSGSLLFVKNYDSKMRASAKRGRDRDIQRVGKKKREHVQEREKERKRERWREGEKQIVCKRGRKRGRKREREREGKR